MARKFETQVLNPIICDDEAIIEVISKTLIDVNTKHGITAIVNGSIPFRFFPKFLKNTLKAEVDLEEAGKVFFSIVNRDNIDVEELSLFEHCYNSVMMNKDVFYTAKNHTMPKWNDAIRYEHHEEISNLKSIKDKLSLADKELALAFQGFMEAFQDMPSKRDLVIVEIGVNARSFGLPLKLAMRVIPLVYLFTALNQPIYSVESQKLSKMITECTIDELITKVGNESYNMKVHEGTQKVIELIYSGTNCPTFHYLRQYQTPSRKEIKENQSFKSEVEFIRYIVQQSINKQIPYDVTMVFLAYEFPSLSTSLLKDIAIDVYVDNANII